MVFDYNLTRSKKEAVLTVYIDGKTLGPMRDDHPNYKAVFDAVVNEMGTKEEVQDLFAPAKAIAKAFKRLSDRLTYADGRLYLDGDPISEGIADHILRLYEAGQTIKPMVAFFEKLLQNPNEHCRKHLFQFMEAERFTLTDDGDVVCYKGVKRGSRITAGYDPTCCTPRRLARPSLMAWSISAAMCPTPCPV